MKNTRFLKIIRTISLFLIVQLGFYFAATAQHDSLFIQDVKKFVFRETGWEPEGDYYTTWNKEEKPYLYIYVSAPDKIECPKEMKSSFIYCGTDEVKAHRQETEFREKGYEVFCYKTFANSGTRLNERLMSYRDETKSFIVFHELIHNYISGQKIEIPYSFNEALCDLLGNYGALKYAQASGKTSIRIVKQQIKINEGLYRCMNSYSHKISNSPRSVRTLTAKCRSKIIRILKSSDTFQKDRFDYPVSTAYLLKNGYYSVNYFLLKKVLLKQHSIKDFLEIIRNMPDQGSGCRKFLMKYT